jgi:hypothetical protein
MVNTYVLVNPHIEGSFDKEIKAKNSIEAAKIVYNNLSEHFNNNVPKFLFTIQKGISGKGKYYSFKVKEERSENEINFSIRPYNIKNSVSAYKNMEEKINEHKEHEEQTGGAKKKSKTTKKKSKTTKKKSKTTKKKSNSDDMSDFEDMMTDDDTDFDDSPRTNKKRVQRYVPNTTFPIYSWYYDPSVYRMNSVYIPTFYSYVTPYIQISLR